MDNKSPSDPLKTSRHRSRATARQAGLPAFWQELKRRKVMRVAITYAVGVDCHPGFGDGVSAAGHS